MTIQQNELITIGAVTLLLHVAEKIKIPPEEIFSCLFDGKKQSDSMSKMASLYANNLILKGEVDKALILSQILEQIRREAEGIKP